MACIQIHNHQSQSRTCRKKNWQALCALKAREAQWTARPTSASTQGGHQKAHQSRDGICGRKCHIPRRLLYTFYQLQKEAGDQQNEGLVFRSLQSKAYTVNLTDLQNSHIYSVHFKRCMCAQSCVYDSMWSQEDILIPCYSGALHLHFLFFIFPLFCKKFSYWPKTDQVVQPSLKDLPSSVSPVWEL